MSFPNIFQTLFIVGSTFPFFIPECLNNFVDSHHHSQHVKTEEGYLLNLAPFSSRFMVLAWCHPLIIVFFVTILFTHPEHFRSLFSLILRSPSSQKYSFSAFISRSPYHTGASFKHYLISSWSLRSRVSNSLEYFRAFFNSYGVSSSFLQLFSILAVVRSRFSLPSLSYQFIRCFNPTGGSLKSFPSLR